jgi:hypothetical protein
MTIIDKLFAHKIQQKQVIWGIRVPKKVKTQWQMLAAIMRIPANRLITYVLNDWVQNNADSLRDSVARNQLAERINKR